MKKVLILVLLTVMMLTAGCVQMDEEAEARLREVFGEYFDTFMQSVAQTPANQPPTAYIDSISPASASLGQTVSLSGHGTDPDGDVVAYRWRSDLDGDLGPMASFGTWSLSVGTHSIYFKVRDSDGAWSEEARSRVTISAGTASPPVINSFDARPGSIGSGDSSLLSWNVSRAISVRIDHGIGDVGSSGIREVYPTAATTYTLTATNAAGSVTATTQVTVSITAPPSSPPPSSSVDLPVISLFTASPGTITPGGSSMLNWLVSDATSVSISQGLGPVVSAGSTVLSPGTTTAYTLTATNAAGSVTRTVQVTVSAAPPAGLPVINSFTANPGIITAGGSSVLSWSVSNATTVTIAYDSSVNPVGPSGSAAASPVTTTTYTLTATNAAGSVNQPVQVIVSGAPPPALPVVHSFTASPGTIASGGSATLSWNVTGATAVSISHGVGVVGLSGSGVVSPPGTITYTLTATSAAGSVTRTAQVIVSGGGGGGGDPFEQALFDEVNARRLSQGVPALTRNPILDGLARNHSQYMVTNGLSHDGFSTRCSQAQTQIGAMACGENVLDAPESWSASQVVDLWWGSPGHKTNMLNPSYARAGMGIARSGGQVYATQFFTD